jgi:hypothetical protein
MKRRCTIVPTPNRCASLRSKDRSSPAPDVEADLLTLLGSGDICNKRWIWEQYDYMVRTNTTQGPGSDAAVVRIKETGTSVAMSLDGNGRYCVLDPRQGAKLLVAECCRNLSTVGAEPIAATNNLNFGNPERPEIMGQIVETIEGMAEACAFFETPITGGNVSLYNETLGGAIFPSRCWASSACCPRRSRHHTVQESRSHHSAARRIRTSRSHLVRRNAVRQAGPGSTLGIAARSRHGLREARAIGHSRNRCVPDSRNRPTIWPTAASEWHSPNVRSGEWARRSKWIGMSARVLCCSTKALQGCWFRQKVYRKCRKSRCFLQWNALGSALQ